MLLKILPGLAVILVVLVVVIITRPGSCRYSRSLSIAAPPDVLFAQVNDLHKFQDWNPWSRVDPSAVLTYAGPADGVGAAPRPGVRPRFLDLADRTQQATRGLTQNCHSTPPGKACFSPS